MISDNTIQKVRDLSIRDVLAPYVELRRHGATLMGCCPFHSEKTPSFSVTESKGLYHCFSCHRAGDAIAFVMEKEGVDFFGAVEKIASAHGIPVEQRNAEELTDEQRRLADLRMSLLAVNDEVQRFFVEQLRVEITDEGRSAREYAHGRWSEEFCAEVGIGYAPRDSRAFLDFCMRKALPEELLFKLGLLKRGEDGRVYAFFRERITIPIRDRRRRIIGFTARYIGKKDAAKYLNSSTCEIFTKGETIFGIDRAGSCRNADFFNVVEGAPDVLRLQSLGIDNTVATLGTAWSDNQFEQMKKLTDSLCFIPDSDTPKDGEPFGPGFKAVITNGSRAMKLGFDVSVRQLPTDSENGKEDADSYIRSIDVYDGLTEKHFLVWLAEKRFSSTKSLVEERRCVAEIAGLLAGVKEKIIIDGVVEQLAKVYGRVKLWRDAVNQEKAQARALAIKPGSAQDERQRDIELLSQFNLTIRDNCYFTFDGENEPTRLSNFILNPLYHIQDERNGTRIFEMINRFGQKRMIEFTESELNSLSTFSQRVGSLGNYVWRAKIDKLNNVKEYTYAKTDSAERIRKMGWDNAGEFFAFGNGIHQGGIFKPVDELGIIRNCNGHTYYIPATSKMYRNNAEVFQFERLMVHENRSGVRLYDYAEKLIGVFGENARVAICYLLSTIFRDIVFSRTRHFPILNLFGEKGTGKTTLATCMQSFFVHGIDPPNLGVTSIPAMNDRVSQAVNTLTVFDEYKNDLDVRKIAYLKGLWGGGGQTKKNTNTDGMAAQTIVSTGVALCGQDKPTQDMALFTRLIFLAFNKTSFSQDERRNYDDLVAVCNLGLTHLLIEVLSHRLIFEQNFPQAYSLTKSELAAQFKDEKIHDRIFGNWVIPLATFRALETVLELPFSYAELFETALTGMRNQNEYAKESSEVADFWGTLQGLQTAGRCVDMAHYRIKYHNRFRPLSLDEDIVFGKPKPVLYLNAPAIAALFSGGRVANSTANRSNWTTTLSYLKSHPAFLGLKQDRFIILTAQGTPDYIIEASATGQTIKRNKINRPKALCFDYEMLKEEFGINLETEMISDAEAYTEDNETTSDSQPQQPDLIF